jgi:leader peptidase (prepilin peptidase)/N-methyltransferase
VLRGKCRACQAPIPLRYVLVEGITAVLFLLAARRYLILEEVSLGACLVLLVLVSALVVASFIDLELRILPDEITLSGMMMAPAVAFLVPDLHGGREEGAKMAMFLESVLAPLREMIPAWCTAGAVAGLAAAAFAGLLGVAGLYGYAAYRLRFPVEGAHRLLDGLLAAVLAGSIGAVTALQLLAPGVASGARIQSFWAALTGMLVGSGLVYAVGVVGTRIFRKPAMGFGDVKLMGLLGAFAGWIGVIQGFFVACLLGSIVGVVILLRSRSRYLPFGPFLALGCLFVILWPGLFERVLNWYLGLFT